MRNYGTREVLINPVKSIFKIVRERVKKKKMEYGKHVLNWNGDDNMERLFREMILLVELI
jgi:hypothetical protein